MKRLERLPEITNQALGGLQAGPELRARILEAAGGERRRLPMRAWISAVACVAVLAVALSIGLPSLTQPKAPEDDQLIHSQAAGADPVKNELALLDLNNNAVVIRQSNSAPAYRSIWADGGTSFPMICVDGRYYRLLTSPAAADRSLLGAGLGAVSLFTTEPALAGTSGVISNSAASGTEVYAVSGMDGTLVAAEVDGSLRLFQRVSFSGNALRGSETLGDTLQIAGHVTAMELSGVGAITDPAVCNSLTATLLAGASYESSGSLSAKQSLLIALDNGTTLQLAVKNDKLAGCGVWSCPEFIDAFTAAVQ